MEKTIKEVEKITVDSKKSTGEGKIDSHRLRLLARREGEELTDKMREAIKEASESYSYISSSVYETERVSLRIGIQYLKEQVIDKRMDT